MVNKKLESVHKGKKPFKCGTCDLASEHFPSENSFDKQDVLNNSVKNGNVNVYPVESVHEGKKLFECGTCDLTSVT